MKRLIAFAAIALAVVGGRASFAQTGDVNRILADARAAMGGEKKLAALKTIAATGQSVRANEEGSSAPADIEMAFDLPDKFMKTDVVGVNNSIAVTRTTGFNGDKVIDVVDQPPSTGGMVFVFRSGAGPADGKPLTPEQQEAQRNARLLATKQDFARIVLGVLVSSPAVYPLEFSYAGQAESPEGKADMVDVKGEGNFSVRLFIDSNTHLPLMLSWKGREPMVIRRTIGGPGPGKSGGTPSGGKVTISETHASGEPPKMTPEQMQKMSDDMKSAEAKLRMVEYRLYYGDYREVDGVKFPFSLQRSIDGKPAEQITFEKVKINSKLDAKKFEAK